LSGVCVSDHIFESELANLRQILTDQAKSCEDDAKSGRLVAVPDVGDFPCKRPKSGIQLLKL